MKTDRTIPPSSILRGVERLHSKSGNRLYFYFPRIDGDLFQAQNDTVEETLLSAGEHLNAEIRSTVLYHFHSTEDVIILSFYDTEVGFYVHPDTSISGRGF